MDKRTNIVRTVWLLRAMIGMIGLVPLLWVPVGLGQTTSITSSGLNTHVSHTTDQQNYDITGGTRPGNGMNLFHSFGDFSVGVHDVARFLNDAHLPTTNILSRVTGGNPSNIFGEINTTNFPGANLYLINPAGVLFGATATLNVSGSVHVSTADYLRLADGLRFNALPGPQDTLLSQAPVVAFGFLSAHPHPIAVQGSRLSVPDGKSLSLVGGNVTVTGGTLAASGGQINVASLAGRGEARIAPEGIAIAGMTPRGQIVIKGGTQQNDGALLDTSGAKGGAVVIRGGRLSMERTEVITEAKSANQTGGDIVIEATKSATFGVGPFTVNDVILKTGSGGGTGSVGGAGSVSLTAPLVTASNLGINVSPSGNGPAGDVAINVGSLTASTLQINSFVHGNRSAPASGNISIRATGDITLQNNSDISTATFGLRDAGHITVQAATLTLTEGSTINSGSQPVGSAGGGSAGNIAIDVGRLLMRTSSMDPQISTDTLTTGHGGDISVRATDSIIINRGSINTGTSGPGEGGSITLFTPRLTLNHFGRITTSAEPLIASPASNTRAGDISVHVRNLDMFNGGRITSFSCCHTARSLAGNINIEASRSISMAGVSDVTSPAFPTEISSTTSSAGKAGHVHIVAPTMHLDDRAVVSTGSQSTGHAGSVVLDVGRLDLLRGARIESNGLERSGNVVINAAQSITLDKGTITTEVLNPGQSGQSGNVSLHAGKSIQLRNGSRISADTAKYVTNPDDFVTQDAGNIVIQAGKSVVVRDSTVSARAQAETGNGGVIVIDAGKHFVSEASTLSVAGLSPAGVDSGQIRVTAGDSVRLSNGTVLDATNSGPGAAHAAHIVLDAGKNVVVDTSRVIAPVSEGEAGRIEMHAGQDVRLMNGTVVDASAGEHVDGGQIVIDAGRNILVDASQVRVPVGDGGAEHKIVMHAGKDARLVNGTVLDASGEASGGGQIVVTGGNVVIDNSRLTADAATGSFGEAGKVTVIAEGSARLINGTLVTASSPILSSSGQVSVTAGNSVQLRNSTIQTSANHGDGGTIGITSETVQLKNGRLVSTANDGTGGTITIKTNNFRRDSASVVDVRGSVANGTINIEPLP